MCFADGTFHYQPSGQLCTHSFPTRTLSKLFIKLYNSHTVRESLQPISRIKVLTISHMKKPHWTPLWCTAHPPSGFRHMIYYPQHTPDPHYPNNTTVLHTEARSREAPSWPTTLSILSMQPVEEALTRWAERGWVPWQEKAWLPLDMIFIYFRKRLCWWRGGEEAIRLSKCTGGWGNQDGLWRRNYKN